MIKKFFPVLAVAALLLLGGCLQQDGPKIGVVDYNAVYQRSDAVTEAKAYMQKKAEDLRAQVSDIQKKVEADNSEENQKAFQQAVAAFQSEMGKENQRLEELLTTAVTDVVEKFRKDNGYAVLLRKDSVASYDEAADVTEQVVAELNKQKIDIAPMMESAPAEQPAAEPAKPETEQPSKPDAEKAQ